MNKLAILLTTVLAAGFVSVTMSDFTIDESLDTRERQQQINDREVSYQCFKRTLDATVEGLMKNEITLREARRRIHAAARWCFADYLVNLTYGEYGVTDDERIARNLVGNHFPATFQLLTRALARNDLPLAIAS